MVRPTCKTCPYFEASITVIQAGKNKGQRRRESDGECHRGIPQIVLIQRLDDPIPDWTPCYWGHFPHVSGRHWCGEHPDFPGWLATREVKQHPEPPHPAEWKLWQEWLAAREIDQKASTSTQ